MSLRDVSPKTLFIVVAVVAMACIVQYSIIAYHMLKTYSIFGDLRYRHVLTKNMLDQVEFSLLVLSISCISYGATLLLIPVIVLMKRKWSRLGDLGFIVIAISYIVASCMLIYGGIMLRGYLDTFHNQCLVAWNAYGEDPEEGIELIFEAIDGLKNNVLIYIRLGLIICFYAHMIAIWGVVIGEESGKKISIGFLLLGIGHLFLAHPVPIVSWVSILGYLYWLYGVWKFKESFSIKRKISI